MKMFTLIIEIDKSECIEKNTIIYKLKWINNNFKVNLGRVGVGLSQLI